MKSTNALKKSIPLGPPPPTKSDDTTVCGAPKPLYMKAHEQIDALRAALIGRLETIEGDMKELSDEYAQVRAALGRVSPAEAQPIAGDANAMIGGKAVNAVPSRW